MNEKLIANLRAEVAKREARREAVRVEMKRITDTVARNGRDRLSSGEETRFAAAERELGEITAQLAELRERIADLTEQDTRDAEAAGVINRYGTGFGNGYVTRDAHIYSPEARHSLVGDFYKASRGDSAAAERLDRNTKMVFEKRAINTTNGTGGEFVPPLWLEDEWIAALRAGRVTADLCVQEELPVGTDVINVPKISSGTAVAQQATQNTAIQQTDLTTGAVSSPVITLAGGQTISMQLVEQSPGKADRIVLLDLAQDYARQVGSTVLNGATGLTGLLSAVPAGGTIAYTDASPGLMGAGKLYAQIAKGISTVETSRFLPPDAIVMHPRRWAWLSVQVDSSNRAAVLPEQNGPFNASGVRTAEDAQGPVGRMFNLPVYVDPQIPINQGTGTNQDTILIGRFADMIWYEQSLRMEAFAQTYAQNLSLFCRVYNYVALIPRVATSLAAIQGTGLVTPTF